MKYYPKTTKQIEVRLVGGAGFCYGVKRALEIASTVLQRHPGPVYTLGPLIHHRQVIDELEKAGIKTCYHPEEIQKGCLIIRSHGLHPGLVQQMKEKGLEIADATCPYVRRAQRLAQQLYEEGYPIVLVGESNHPEVIGIRGYVGEKLMVLSGPEEVGKLPKVYRLGVIAQTTQTLENFQQVIDRLIFRVKELRVFNTICTYTIRRQKETANLAKKVELMLVVGGKNSSNTKKLAEISRQVGVLTYHIETANEIQSDWLVGKGKIGITGGASTPAESLFRVIEHLRTINSRRVKLYGR